MDLRRLLRHDHVIPHWAFQPGDKTRLTNIQPKIPSRITVFLVKEVSVLFNHWGLVGTDQFPHILKEGCRQGEWEGSSPALRLQALPPALPSRTPFPASCSLLVSILYHMDFDLQLRSVPRNGNFSLDEHQILIRTGFASSLGSTSGNQWANPTYPMLPTSPGPTSPGQAPWT